MLKELSARRISARELLERHVERNQKLAAKLNAVVVTDLPRARKDADAIDAAHKRGEAVGPLAGLPMTIKDGFDVENMPATSGNPQFKDRPRDCRDAEMVTRARKAGAVIWGKTNVPFMLMDFQSYNAIYGTTNNPYDVTRTPGGSSGGAAAALASGITPLEIGSDIGGSLRHPANYCGVCSLKPTWGVLDLRGHVPPLPEHFYETDLGVVGPMARNSEDLKLLWSVLNRSPARARQDIKEARIAIWDEEPGFPLSKEIRDAVSRAATALGRAGAATERDKPNIEGQAVMADYTEILAAIIGVDLPDEAVGAFQAMHASDVEAVQKGNAPRDARFRLAATASFRDMMHTVSRRDAMKGTLEDFFAAGFDAILMPISPVAAFPHLHEPGFNERMLSADGSQIPYPSMLNWIAPATFLHAPAIAVPAGRTPSGLPVGVQLVGPWHAEDRLFDFAAALEDQLGGFKPPEL
jgi:amidase